MKRLDRGTEESLILEARKASRNAYAPFSKVKVGAAILTSDGRTFSGCNVENSSYGLTICAERTAAVKAVSSGARGFRAIAVVSNLDGVTYPCGACRQFLSEFGKDVWVIVSGRDDTIGRHVLSDLLPESFSLNK